MSNTITIELSAEDRARLDRIAELLLPLEALRHWQGVPSAEKPAEAPEAVEAAAPEKYTPEEPEPPVAPPAPAEEPKKAPSTEELQAIVQELAAPGSDKRAAVRDLVKSYADRVSLIPEDKRAEAMERLLALKEGKA